MTTPLEKLILLDFEARLTESDVAPSLLVDKLIALIDVDSTPSADALVALFKSNVGVQSV